MTIMCQQEKYQLSKQIFLFFFFNINNSQSVYNKYLPFLQNILNELTCRTAMFCLAGKELWGSWFSVLLDMLCLSSIRCACPQCDVVVLDTPYLSSIRCACPRYSVPVLSTLSCPFAVPILNSLSWPFAVPVPFRN